MESGSICGENVTGSIAVLRRLIKSINSSAVGTGTNLIYPRNLAII
jgi:hypothetical protein